MMSTSQDRIKEIFEKIVEKVDDQGDKFWEKPWFSSGFFPSNFTTGREYAGFNVLLLEMERLVWGYEHNLWAGFGQIREKGGIIAKGQKGTVIITYSPPVFKDVEDERTGEIVRKMVRAPYFSTGVVFNIAQSDMDPEEFLPKKRDFVGVDEIEKFVSDTEARIDHDKTSAFYDPRADYVGMPPRASFKSEVGYYGTLLHELIHWSGHFTRCSRIPSDYAGVYGRQNEYAEEELVAEIGSVFLRYGFGIDMESDEFGLDNAARYIRHWWNVIKSDPLSLMRAGSAAQGAVSYLREIPEKKKRNADLLVI